MTEQVEIGSAAIYIYPSIHNNLWLKGGFGVARLEATDNGDNGTADGVAVSAGVGYDWAVGGGSFVLTPFAGYLRQMNGKEKFNGVDDGFTPNANLYQFGVGLGYRH